MHCKETEHKNQLSIQTNSFPYSNKNIQVVSESEKDVYMKVTLPCLIYSLNMFLRKPDKSILWIL